jgi:hypothetical protein
MVHFGVGHFRKPRLDVFRQHDEVHMTQHQFTKLNYDGSARLELPGGFVAIATLHADDDCTPPWDREDGHGPVSDWTTRAKKPGERVLNRDHRSYRYYDFQAAVKQARAEEWDTPPYRTGTAGERATRAAEADFQRMKAWCDNEWSYVGMAVTIALNMAAQVWSHPQLTGAVIGQQAMDYCMRGALAQAGVGSRR